MFPARSLAAILAAVLLAGCTAGMGNLKGLAPEAGGQQPPAGGQAQGNATAQPGAGSQQPAGNATQPGGGSSPENATEPQQPPARQQPPAQPAIRSEELSYASFGWRIYGTLYPAQSREPAKTIYLLHMLGTNRSDYPMSFITRLHNEIPDAAIVAIDMRGHGSSTNLGTWQGFELDNYKGMKDDVASAMNLLKARYPTLEEDYIVGASMGSSTAILTAAQRKTVTKVAMISPGLDYKGVAIRGAAEDYYHDVFIAASRGDIQSAAAASEIYALTSSPAKTLKIYEGAAHGAELFDATKNGSEPLETLLVGFLKG